MKPKTLENYIKDKIKVLNQLCIELSWKELEHLKSLKSEIQVDNYARELIKRRR